MFNRNINVAIIITTYNQDLLLIKCLNSLKKTNYKNYRIYFLDDSGKGEIGEKIKKKFPYIKTILNKKNLGFSKSNNIGIKEAIKDYSPEYILLLNDDTEIVGKHWLKMIIEAGESDSKIGILGCRIVYPDGSLQNIGGYLKKGRITKILYEDKEKIIDVDHVMGAFMMIKREVIEQIGLLDEIYTPFLLEDTDYCLRAKEKGFLIKSVSNVSIIHKKGKTIDSLRNKKNLFIRFKNDIFFSFRHLEMKYAFFRAFIYLPLVAIFRKNRDEDELKMKNFRLRKDFLLNLFYLTVAYLTNLRNIKNVSRKKM